MTLARRARSARSCVVVLSIVAATASAGAQEQNRAGVVVQYDEGRVATYCVRFDEPSISGLDLLTRAGLRPVAEVGGLGAAVCSLDGQGCAYPAQPCFCQCQGSDCAYWNYLHRVDSGWRYSPIGAASYAVGDGAIDAWAWGDHVAPPLYTIDQICSESPAPPTAPVVAPATSTPAPDHTSTPAEASQPAPSPAPVIAPSLQRSLSTLAPDEAAPTATLAAVRAADPAASAAPVDAGGYLLVAAVAAGLGGWWLAGRIRRR